MKTILLFTLIFLVSFNAFSQSNSEFKSAKKKSSGSTQIGFNYQTISKSGSLKSANQKSKFQMSSNFYKPTSLRNPLIKKVIRSKKSGTPIFIEIEQGNLKSAGVLSSEEKFWNFFETTKGLTNIDNPDKDLLIEEVYTDDLGITHTKAKQHYNGVEIYGAEVILHLNNQKEIFTGKLINVHQKIDVNPGLESQNAIDFAIEDLKKYAIWKEISDTQKDILSYESPSSDLVIYQSKEGTTALCYEINIRPNFLETWKYFIDAKNGQVVFKYNNTKSDGPAVANGYDLNGVLRTIDTYLENGTYYLANTVETMYNEEKGEGMIMTYDANNTPSSFSLATSADNTWNNPATISLHHSSTKMYKYLEDTFGRNSINNQGGNIIGIVNLSSEDGSGYDNAYWSSPLIYFGNGGSSFYNLAGGLDVVAHEMGHGVVENTANLEYQYQSGAINETYADIFGSMVDREDWLIGEDVTNSSYISTGALRDMANPHNGDLNGWQPMHVSEMYIGENDRGGVHINSGIGNYAYYLYATAITKEKAEQVFYRALANYLTTKSQFIDFRIAVIQSAKDLYGDSSAEVIEAINAFDAVGIFEEEQIDYAQEYPTNDGPEYMLSYDTDSLNPNTLYRSSTIGDDFYALTTTTMKGKVSVVDEGNVAVFVSDDSKIRAIGTYPASPDEFILSDEAFWDNVAVSKDGNRLACISIEIDTAIYVYDFVSEKWTKFHLYNPTTSHSGTDAGGVLFADAIEFDHTGEYLMYDAYNELSTTSEDPISYWDIGFIKVWDNENNTFGDGSIEKLYGSLPEDVSIGNPVFSKNSPYIIAFDYWDSYLDEYAILGANLLTGELDIITMNTRLGYPSYSKLDDKISYTAYDTNNDDIIAIIGLASNKISPNGESTAIIEDAIWSVYYATGTRTLSLAPVTNFTVDVKSGKAPLTVQFIDLTINNPTSWNWTFDGGNPSNSSDQNPTVTYNNGGIYQVSLTASNTGGSNTISKTSYITINDNTGINDELEEIVNYYPNPVSGIINIECDKEFIVRIYNMLGKKLVDVQNQNQLDLSSYNSGIYVIQIEIDGSIIHGKIQKN